MTALRAQFRTVATWTRSLSLESPFLNAAVLAARDLTCYYALVDREGPRELVTRMEACLTRDALLAL